MQIEVGIIHFLWPEWNLVLEYRCLVIVEQKGLQKSLNLTFISVIIKEKIDGEVDDSPRS